MSAYEEPPMESGAFAMIVSIFAVPLRPVPRYMQNGRTFAGGNPLKWFVVVLAAIGYALAILLYFLFALFPALSYVMLIVLTLPLVIAVYAWKGLVHLAHSSRRSNAEERTTTRIRPASGNRRRPA